MYKERERKREAALESCDKSRGICGGALDRLVNVTGKNQKRKKGKKRKGEKVERRWYHDPCKAHHEVNRGEMAGSMEAKEGKAKGKGYYTVESRVSV